MPYADSANGELPFQTGSDTSHDAAVAAKAFNGRQQTQYREWLALKGEDGGTDKEAAKELEMERSSICARRGELKKAGRVIDTERRRSGCAVWRLIS